MRRNPPAKWTLPTEVNPPGRKTIILCIPDDPYHVAAFRGAMLALASAYNWQDDPLHKAKDVANVWKSVIEQEGTCLDFRQDDCHLYLVVNGIETLIYNGQECIDANIADGTLQKANSGYLGNPGAGACHAYQITLKPAQSFVLPQVVNSGDTILLSNWKGGSTDWGLGSTFWICPSGTAYALGSCSDVPRVATSYGTDPLATAPHLSVIAQIGSTYYDVWNSLSGITPATFTVPGGITNQPCRMLLNIGTGVALTATGEVWGEVILCNTSQWCYHWDFTTGLHSWVLQHGTQDSSGLHTVDWLHYKALQATLTLAGSASITSVRFKGTWSQGNYAGTDALRLMYNNEASYLAKWSNTDVPNGAFDVSKSFGAISASTNLTLAAFPDDALPLMHDATITDLYVTGSGSNPFGSNNC